MINDALDENLDKHGKRPSTYGRWRSSRNANFGQLSPHVALSMKNFGYLE